LLLIKLILHILIGRVVVIDRTMYIRLLDSENILTLIQTRLYCLVSSAMF